MPLSACTASSLLVGRQRVTFIHLLHQHACSRGMPGHVLLHQSKGAAWCSDAAGAYKMLS